MRIVVLAAALLVVAGAWFFPGRSQNGERTSLQSWRPNQDTKGIRYVGSETCAECHEVETERYSSMPMARALSLPADCEVLAKNPRLSFRNGDYTYQITRQGGRSLYSVSNGSETIAEPILYCFGLGVVGQTYVFRHNGSLYESRVSFYRELKGLDVTIGQTRVPPTSISDAIGRPLAEDEVRSCFGCHTTAAIDGSRLQLERLAPGVRCEACHGPGEKHVAAVRAKDLENLQIFNPSNLSGYELSQEFCGTCHTGFEQAMLLSGQGGVNNIRFQPYRMFNSPGHNKVDRRVSCVACHDPHAKLEHNPRAYDSKCTACHLLNLKDVKTKERSADPCPVSTRDCVTCHMPKVELPGMHAKFTDHWIRIARPGAPTPR